MVGSLFFLGFGLGAATLLRLADVKGRKPMFMFSLAASMILMSGYLVATSLKVIYILTFLNGFVLAARISVGYMYELEMVATHRKKQINFLGSL